MLITLHGGQLPENVPVWLSTQNRVERGQPAAALVGLEQPACRVWRWPWQLHVGIIFLRTLICCNCRAFINAVFSVSSRFTQITLIAAQHSHNSVTSHTQISDLFEGLILRSHPIGSKSKCNRVSQPPRRLWYSITLGLWPRCLRTSKFLSSVDLPRNCMHHECFLIPRLFSKMIVTSAANWYMLQHHGNKHENLELWRH